MSHANFIGLFVDAQWKNYVTPILRFTN